MINTPERVLVIPTAEFFLAGPFQGFLPIESRPDLGQYLEGEIPSAIAFYKDRAEAEADPEHKQLISYVGIMCGDSILTYRRGVSGGEDRLHGKISIGIGGHINPSDHESFPFTAYNNGAIREIREEIGLEVGIDALQKTLIGLVNDDTSDVGRVHLGVCHVIHVNEIQAEKILKNCESTMSHPLFVPIAEFENPELFDQLESWASFMMAHLLQEFAKAGKWHDADFRERVSMLALTASNLASAALGFVMQENPRAHMLSREQVEQAAGAVQCMLSGLVHNADISQENLKAEGKKFYDNLGNILKYQPTKTDGA